MGLFSKKKKDDKSNDNTFLPYTKEEYVCQKCGSLMMYVGGLLDWECPTCGAEGSIEYDNVNKEYYVSVAESYTYEEIYSDPIRNEPDCCKACGGPYPNCLSSCKMFDD